MVCKTLSSRTQVGKGRKIGISRNTLLTATHTAVESFVVK